MAYKGLSVLCVAACVLVVCAERRIDPYHDATEQPRETPSGNSHTEGSHRQGHNQHTEGSLPEKDGQQRDKPVHSETRPSQGSRVTDDVVNNEPVVDNSSPQTEGHRDIPREELRSPQQDSSQSNQQEEVQQPPEKSLEDILSEIPASEPVESLSENKEDTRSTFEGQETPTPTEGGQETVQQEQDTPPVVGHDEHDQNQKEQTEGEYHYPFEPPTQEEEEDDAEAENQGEDQEYSFPTGAPPLEDQGRRTETPNIRGPDPTGTEGEMHGGGGSNGGGGGGGGGAKGEYDQHVEIYDSEIEDPDETPESEGDDSDIIEFEDPFDYKKLDRNLVDRIIRTRVGRHARHVQILYKPDQFGQVKMETYIQSKTKNGHTETEYREDFQNIPELVTHKEELEEGLAKQYAADHIEGAEDGMEAEAEVAHVAEPEEEVEELTQEEKKGTFVWVLISIGIKCVQMGSADT